MLVEATVIATCFNNSLHIEEFLERTLATLVNAKYTFEIIVVDDGSTDQSYSKITLLSKHEPRIRGIRLSRNFGQHPAILAGLDLARGKAVVLMDSDLDDAPELLPDLIRPILEDKTDIVLTRSSHTKRQRLSSRVFHALVQRATKSPDLFGIGTYRAFNAQITNSLKEYRDHSSLYGPLSTQLGFRQTTIDISSPTTTRSPSTYNFRRRLSLAWPLLLHEVGLALKVMLSVVGFILLLALSLGVVALSRFIAAGGDVLSTSSLVFLVLIVNQVLLGIGIAINAFYSRSILRESLRRPRYHISDDTLKQSRN